MRRAATVDVATRAVLALRMECAVQLAKLHVAMEDVVLTEPPAQQITEFKFVKPARVVKYPQSLVDPLAAMLECPALWSALNIGANPVTHRVLHLRRQRRPPTNLS